VLSFFNAAEKANLTIFDIGANIGLYSQIFLKENPTTRIIAFEPSQLARASLRNTFADDNRVTIVPIALGKFNGEATLYSNEAGNGLSSLTKRRVEHFGLDFTHNENVKIESLDNWNHQDIPVQFLKIDVEGHELDVLMGALKTLKAVKVIQFEFGGCNIDSRTYFQDFWYFFTEMEFSIFRINPKGTIRINTYSEELECFKVTNYLAVRSG